MLCRAPCVRRACARSLELQAALEQREIGVSVLVPAHETADARGDDNNRERLHRVRPRRLPAAAGAAASPDVKRFRPLHPADWVIMPYRLRYLMHTRSENLALAGVDNRCMRRAAQRAGQRCAKLSLRIWPGHGKRHHGSTRHTGCGAVLRRPPYRRRAPRAHGKACRGPRSFCVVTGTRLAVSSPAPPAPLCRTRKRGCRFQAYP